jgi:hypothetical protein
MDTNDRHLISHSFLTTSNWITLVNTPRSLPPLQPCITFCFRQGWGCKCTFRIATPDLGFAGPRIIPTNPSSMDVVCFAINSTTCPELASYSIRTTHSAVIVLQVSAKSVLLYLRCVFNIVHCSRVECNSTMPMPPFLPLFIVTHESLIYSPLRCPRAGLTQNCPTLGIPRDIHCALQISARNTSIEPCLALSATHT